jgi:hypothetical protein
LTKKIFLLYYCNDNSYIKIGLNGTIIGPYIIVSYQNRFWFGICSKWNGKVFYKHFFFKTTFILNTIITNDENNEQIFNSFCINLNLNSIKFGLNQ